MIGPIRVWSAEGFCGCLAGRGGGRGEEEEVHSLNEAAMMRGCWWLHSQTEAFAAATDGCLGRFVPIGANKWGFMGRKKGNVGMVTSEVAMGMMVLKGLSGQLEWWILN